MRDGAKYKLRALRTWKTVSLCDIKTNKKPTEAAIKTREKSRHVRARKQDSCCSFLATATDIADAGPILSSALRRLGGINFCPVAEKMSRFHISYKGFRPRWAWELATGNWQSLSFGPCVFSCSRKRYFPWWKLIAGRVAVSLFVWQLIGKQIP